MALWRRSASRPAPPAGLERPLAALDRDQREAATAPPGPLLVIAGAGAGTTRTLIARAARGGFGAGSLREGRPGGPPPTSSTRARSHSARGGLARYARLARAASAFDFEDMLAAACHLLAEDDAIRSML